MATEDTISHIAKSLGEVEEIPLFQISGIVRVLGEDGALTLLAETSEIEKGGGMMLADGTRRRSPGGVFFQLARRKLPSDEKKIIFREKKQESTDAPPPSSSTGSASVNADASRFARRRVVEVVPARPNIARPKSGGGGGAFSPPELPSALARARIRQQVSLAVAPLPLEDQYHLFLDMLADIHDRVSASAPAVTSSAVAPAAQVHAAPAAPAPVPHAPAPPVAAAVPVVPVAPVAPVEAAAPARATRARPAVPRRSKA